MGRYVTYVLVAVLILSVVYLGCEFQDKRYRRFKVEGWDTWQKSNGTMDDPAILSYRRLLRVPKKKRSYTDEFILDQVLHTNIPNSTETRGKDPGIHRRRIQKEDGDTLNRTLTLLNESPQLNFTRETYNNRGRRMRRDVIHPIFVLDRLEPRVDRLPNAGDMRQRVQECRRKYIQAARNDAIEDNGDDEAVEEDTHQAQTERVIDAGISHTSDPQNVHDNAVNISFRRTLDRIKWDRGGNSLTAKAVDRCFLEARDFIDKHAKDENDKNRLNMVLTQIAEGHTNSSFGGTEDQIFSVVWDRSKNPANIASGRVTSIKHAVLDALRDMGSDNGNMVCSSGRCGRLVGSLTCVDYDPEMAKIHSLEMVRNEILEKTKSILSECILEASGSTRPHLNEISREYTDPLYDASQLSEKEMARFQAAKDEFQKNLVSRVNLMVDGYSTDISPKDVENIRTYCIEAVQ